MGPLRGDTDIKGTPARRYLFRRNEVVFGAEIRVGLEILSTKRSALPTWSPSICQ